MESFDNFEQRFWSKVKIGKPDECWEWQDHLTNKGYGQISRDHKSFRAHRVAWELVNGKIPDGILVLHKCDNRKCVNPNHLFLGTHLDNNLDKIRKGRTNWRGRTPEMHYKTKLTEADVREIRQMVSNGLSQRKASILFSISNMTVNHIVKRKIWKCVE